MNKRASKLPWMKFYPADWMSDTALRQCSIAARGLWIEMVCIMWTNVPPGHFNGSERPDFIARLSRMTATGESELKTLLDELLGEGVASRNADQVIYSRRMVRECQQRAEMSRRGSKGGNPMLIHKDKQEDNHMDKHSLHIASASDSCHSEGGPGETETDPPPTVRRWDGGFSLADGEALIAAWNSTPGYRATRVDLHGLEAVYADLAVSPLSPEAAQENPVAWLLGRVGAFVKSHTATTDGGKWKGKLGNWIRPREGRPCRALESDASWARPEFTDAETNHAGSKAANRVTQRDARRAGEFPATTKRAVVDRGGDRAANGRGGSGAVGDESDAGRVGHSGTGDGTNQTPVGDPAVHAKPGAGGAVAGDGGAVGSGARTGTAGQLVEEQYVQ